jgi:hypothetical protein
MGVGPTISPGLSLFATVIPISDMNKIEGIEPRLVRALGSFLQILRSGLKEAYLVFTHIASTWLLRPI